MTTSIEIVGTNPYCSDRWPECYSGSYNPSCCRFPKSCSSDLVEMRVDDRKILEEQTKHVDIRSVFRQFKDFKFHARLLAFDYRGYLIAEIYFKTLSDAIYYAFNKEFRIQELTGMSISFQEHIKDSLKN